MLLAVAATLCAADHSTFEPPARKAEKGAPVVAILGGLHVNGVARLLLSEATPDADAPRTADGVWWQVPPEIDTAKWV